MIQNKVLTMVKSEVESKGFEFILRRRHSNEGELVVLASRSFEGFPDSLEYVIWNYIVDTNTLYNGEYFTDRYGVDLEGIQRLAHKKFSTR